MSDMEVDWRQLVDHTSVCDFCGGAPTWMHEAMEFGVGDADGIVTFDPYWAVCDACHVLIDVGANEPLVEHMYAQHVRNFGEPTNPVHLKMYITAVVLGFMSTRTGKTEAFG